MQNVIPISSIMVKHTINFQNIISSQNYLLKETTDLTVVE